MHAGPHSQEGLPAHLDVHSLFSGKSGVDEYSDDDDVGYFTIPVTRQEEFVLTELQLSDDEGSPTRSSYGYHRYRLAAHQNPCRVCLSATVTPFASGLGSRSSRTHAGIGQGRLTRRGGAALGSPRCREAWVTAPMGEAAAAVWAATS